MLLKLQLATRNVLRHGIRSAIALSAIAFGVAALILAAGFVSDLYFQLGESLIRSQSGHLQVAQPALFAEGSRAPEKYRIADAKDLAARIARLPAVVQVMPRLSFDGLLNNGRTDAPVIVEGIDPSAESQLATALSILEGSGFADMRERGILVGEGLATRLRLHSGDRVTLLASTFDGAINAGEFVVVGIFRSFSKDYDDRALKVPLTAAQELLNAADANRLLILLDDTSSTAGAAAAVQDLVNPSGLAVRRWEELNDFYANTVALYERQFFVLRLIIMAMVVLGVANAINMSVFERTSEFGTMRALGNKSGFVSRLILLECVLLGLAGAILGISLGLALGLLLSQVGIPMPPPPNSNAGYVARITPDVRILTSAALVGAVATVFAGIIPALRTRRQTIVDALRASI